MSAHSLADSRDWLLKATVGLIHRDGVGIGVEALCRAAGVSKRSMYQLFSGKDEPLAASLERLAADRCTPLLPGPNGPYQPRERILHVFPVLQERAALPAYRGCPYLAVQVELTDEGHAASKVAARVERS